MSKLTRKIISVGLSLTTAVWLSGTALVIPVVQAQTAEELTAQINALMATIQELQAKITAMGGTTPTVTSCTFTRDLTVGSTGDDVKCLQQYLNGAGYKVAETGVGSPGSETTYFGTLTQNAVSKWQAANGITPTAGYFGSKSQAKYTSVAAVTPPPAGGTTPPPGGTTPPPTVTVPEGKDLLVELAKDNPGAAYLGSGTSFNPVLKIAITAGSKDVAISSIKIKKQGYVQNSQISGIDIIDSKGVRHGNVISSINADNEVSIPFPTAEVLTIKAGTIEYLTVRVSLASTATAGTLYFELASDTAIGADTSAIAGTFALKGNQMSLTDSQYSVATVTLDLRLVLGTSGATLNVDEANGQEITKFRIAETSSNEPVNIEKLTLYNNGNASDKDYKDVQLVAQDGTIVATAQPSGQYVVFDLSASPYKIDKGVAKDFTIKTKIAGGASRTIQFVIYNDYDLVVKGANTGISILPRVVSGGTDTSFPIGATATYANYNKATVGSGSLSFNRDASSPTAAVVPGSQNITLAKYYAKPIGEDMELRKVSFGLLAVARALTGTIYVKVNDSTVYSTAYSATTYATSGTVVAITLSSYPILKAGQNSYITVEASISTDATASDSYYVNDFDITEVKRLITNDILDPSVSVADGNSIAIKAADLVVTTLAQPIANSVVAGTNLYELARIELNASAGGEDVKVTHLIVTDTLTGGNTSYAGIVNLKMFKGSEELQTSASTAENANTKTFAFTQPILVSRSAAVTLSLKGDVLSVTSSTIHTFNIAANDDHITALGATTGNTLAAGAKSQAGSGQAMTVASAGTLTLSTESGTPSINQLVQVGTTGATVLVFKLASQYEAQKIQKLVLTASSTATANLQANDIINLKLYKDSATTPFATLAQMASSSGVYTATWNWADNWDAGTVNPGTPVKITVKADIGGGGVAKLGDNFVFKIASTTTDITSVGAVTGTAASSKTGTPTASGISYIAPFNVAITGIYPTTATTLKSGGAGTKVAVFKVSNDSSTASRIYLDDTTLNFTKSGAATTSITFGLYSSVAGGSDLDTSITYKATSTATGAAASTTVPFDISAVSAANREIAQNSYRYLTIVTASASAADGDTCQFAVSSLGNISFDVVESDLGYDGNIDGDLGDTISGLYVSGTPTLQTITIDL